MDFSRINNSKSWVIITASVCVALLILIISYTFLSSVSKNENTEYVYIDTDDTVDSVFIKIEQAALTKNIAGVSTLMRHSNYPEHIRTGRYALNPGDNAITVFRKMKNGQQTPMNITIPSVRTAEKLCEEIGKKLMIDAHELADSIADSVTCQKYGYEPATILCMFTPNTYEIFWNTSINKFLDRMHRESEIFWNDSRRKKAAALALTREEVITLASIIDEETANNAEKPMIAGMYYNRLNLGMPLQADPTVKFAKGDFTARRVYRAWLTIDSPYNTYRYAGLPPGPIRIPSVAGIDAVLNMVQHDYLYMCAKEDFSGTHNFAASYAEHLKNAARYAKALNDRGIK